MSSASLVASVGSSPSALVAYATDAALARIGGWPWYLQVLALLWMLGVVVRDFVSCVDGIEKLWHALVVSSGGAVPTHLETTPSPSQPGGAVPFPARRPA